METHTIKTFQVLLLPNAEPVFEVDDLEELNEYLEFSVLLNHALENVHSCKEHEKESMLMLSFVDCEKLDKNLFQVFYNRLGEDVRLLSSSELLVRFITDTMEFMARTATSLMVRVDNEDQSGHLLYYSGFDVMVDQSRLAVTENIDTINISLLMHGLYVSPFVNTAFLTTLFDSSFELPLSSRHTGVEAVYNQKAYDVFDMYEGRKVTMLRLV